ncbi:XkdX family protein [Chakrabartyella piscis]|uniref:XkdX family protein n=1 Tax=Chakrabartyella piscis TaxID=2918914 RepID=UPI002958A265|nr:XkdX family protein [Chakrabartyella piscis]
MYEILKAKFELGFVRADQLLRYVTIGYLTEAQYHLIVYDEVLMTEDMEEEVDADAEIEVEAETEVEDEVDVIAEVTEVEEFAVV